MFPYNSIKLVPTKKFSELLTMKSKWSIWNHFQPQEKFQNSPFVFKKGNNWDFKGISLGKPKIGKVLPKPVMGFLNLFLFQIMGFFKPEFYPKMGYFWASFIPVLGLKLPILIPNKGISRSQVLPNKRGFLGLKFPIQILTSLELTNGFWTNQLWWCIFCSNSCNTLDYNFGLNKM